MSLKVFSQICSQQIKDGFSFNDGLEWSRVQEGFLFKQTAYVTAMLEKKMVAVLPGHW